MKRSYRIDFPLLRDLHNEVAKQFGNDPTAWNDTEVWELPMPARFIIGSDGIIVDAEVNPDYTAVG
jgi:peroxiredoxin